MKKTGKPGGTGWYSLGVYSDGELIDGYEDGNCWLYLTTRIQGDRVRFRKLDVPANPAWFSRNVFANLETTDIWKGILKPAADAESALYWEKKGWRPKNRERITTPLRRP
jgi:hypothetical protein